MLASFGTTDPIEFRILGPLEVVRGGKTLRVPAGKQRALLASLLLRANEVVSSDRLIEELWGERPPETAPAALRVHVAHLRKALADGGVVTTRAPGYVLEVDEAQVDLRRFERLADVGGRALADGRWADAEAALAEALALRRGPPLAGLEYEPFAQSAVARLEELHLTVLEQWIEACLALGRHVWLVPQVEALAAEHPLRERLCGQLMLALYRSGRQAEALEVYRQKRRTLARELGIEPTRELQRLHGRMLTQDPVLDLAAPPEIPSAEATRPLTALAVAMPDDVGDDVLNLVVDAVFANGGRIDADADEVLAVFGLPVASEDDVERAVHTALALRERFAATGATAAMAVATGDARRSVVSLAQRLAAHARPGQILVSAATHRLARLAFEFSPVDVESAAPADARVRAYEVFGRLARQQKTRGVEGLSAALHGRDAELGQLRRALAELDAAGRLVLIGGDAGVGKSRLVAELHAAAPEGDVRWLEGRCRASGSATGYLPYLELLAQHFGWVPEDDDRERERAIVTSALDLVRRGHLDGEQIGDLLPLLATLLSVQTAETQPLADVSPEQLRNRVFAAVRTFLLALAAERLLVLVLEDFHWADALSFELTAELMEAVPDSRLLLVVVSRPDPVYRWSRLTALAEQTCGGATLRIELRELSRTETNALLDELLPAENLPERLRGLILDSAQGNPFFLEEILQSLVESGAVSRVGRRWHVRDDLESLTIPESVEAVIVSRVDGLESRERAVLEVASVVGRSFGRRLLGHVTADVGDVERAVWELEGRGLVYEDRLLREDELSFKHVLTQEAVYRTLPDRRRAELHERVGHALEELFGDALEERYEQLAYHYERSADKAKAAEFLALAGEKASRRYLNADAIAYFERALACGPPRPLAARVHEGLGDTLRRTGRHDDALVAYAAAFDLVDARDVVGRARIDRKRASALHVQRRIDDAHAALDRGAATLSDASADADGRWWEERVEIELKRLWLRYFFGDSDRLLDELSPVVALVRRHGTATQRGRIFNLLAAARVRGNRATADEETLDLARRAYDAALESGELGEIAQAHQMLGFTLLWAGRVDEAAAELRHALALSERAGDATLEARTLPYLTLACRRRGAVDVVRELADRTLAVGERTGMAEYVAQAKANRAWVAWREGDLDRAESEAGEAWALWTQVPGSLYRMLDWIVAWPRIAAAEARGRTDDAIALLRELADPARQPMPPELERAVEAALGAWTGGDVEAARTSLAHATAEASRHGYL